MAKVTNRFTVLFSDEELLLLKDQAQIRGLSAGELVRHAVQNEITGRSNYDKLNALRKIHSLAEVSYRRKNP